jgi:hypothetical protein
MDTTTVIAVSCAGTAAAIASVTAVDRHHNLLILLSYTNIYAHFVHRRCSFDDADIDHKPSKSSSSNTKENIGSSSNDSRFTLFHRRKHANKDNATAAQVSNCHSCISNGSATAAAMIVYTSCKCVGLCCSLYEW